MCLQAEERPVRENCRYVNLAVLAVIMPGALICASCARSPAAVDQKTLMDLKILSQIHSPHSLFELRAVAEHPESMGIARNQSDAATALRMSEIALSDTNEAVAEWKRLPSSRQIRAELAFVDRQEERLRSTNQGIKREGWVVDAGADVTQLDTLALAGHKAPSLQPPMLCYFMHVDPNGKIALATKFFHSGVAQFQPMICAQLEYYEQARRLIRQGYYVLK